jgi:hypothetical protein
MVHTLGPLMLRLENTKTQNSNTVSDALATTTSGKRLVVVVVKILVVVFWAISCIL